MNSSVSLSGRSARPRGAWLFLLSLIFGSTRADVVSAWNQVLGELAATPQFAQPAHLEARTHALVHLALVDAVDAAARDTSRDEDRLAAQRAAVASAGEYILADLYPDARVRVEAMAREQVAAIPDSPGKTRGLAIGRVAAKHALQTRANDGWNALGADGVITGLAPDQSESLAKAVAAGGAQPSSRWLLAQPFVLKSASQLQAPVPALVAFDGTTRVHPTLTDAKFFAVVNRSLEAGALQRSWEERPVRAWNRLARAIAESRALSLAEEARLLAALNVALADAALSTLHWRYTLGSWSSTLVETWGDGRGTPASPTDKTAPAVFDGLHDGVARLETRRVLIPPLANYPAFGAAIAGAAQGAMIEVLKGDRNGFSVEMPTADGGAIRRSYGSIAEAARESAFVVTLDGRHTRESGIAGHEFGRAVGREVARRFERARR